jgi:hypothetical protein
MVAGFCHRQRDFQTFLSMVSSKNYLPCGLCWRGTRSVLHFVFDTAAAAHIALKLPFFSVSPLPPEALNIVAFLQEESFLDIMIAFTTQKQNNVKPAIAKQYCRF